MNSRAIEVGSFTPIHKTALLPCIMLNARGFEGEML